MNEFLTWEMIENYPTFVSLVFAFVGFTKELPFIKKIPTRYYAFVISYALLLAVGIHNGTFDLWSLVPYFGTATFITVGSNGLSDVNNPKPKK